MSPDESVYMQYVDLLGDYVIPATVAIVMISYVVMYRYIKKNQIKLSPLTSCYWFDVRTGYYLYEIPYKYLDEYKLRHEEIGPGIKLLFLGLSLFITSCLAIGILIVGDLVN